LTDEMTGVILFYVVKRDLTDGFKNFKNF